MRPRLLALVPVATLAMILVPSAAHAGAANGRSNASAHDIAQYWTSDRMKAAKPKPMARPGGGGGGSPAASTEWVGPYPKEHGKVFFSEGSSNYVCSGTAVTAASGRTIVWTAGHCVWDDAGGFVQNFAFVPAYRDATRPYGTYGASDITGDGTALHTSDSWAAPGQEFGVDVGAVEVRNGAAALSSLTAGIAMNFAAGTSGTYVAHGYPAAGKFNGQRLRTCTSPQTYTDPNSAPAAIGIACDMTGGSSGGGWTKDGQVVSNTSFGYSSLKNVLFGPHLGSDARDVFVSAGGF